VSVARVGDERWTRRRSVRRRGDAKRTVTLDPGDGELATVEQRHRDGCLVTTRAVDGCDSGRHDDVPL
jgi:hypothetical protein